MVGNAVSGVRLVAPAVRSRWCREKQWLSLRRGTANAPMSRYGFVAMIIVNPITAADPPENTCLPSPGTTVKGSCTECLEPMWSDT